MHGSTYALDQLAAFSSARSIVFGQYGPLEIKMWYVHLISQMLRLVRGVNTSTLWMHWYLMRICVTISAVVVVTSSRHQLFLQ